MIIVRLMGGLGNQMFQYAAGRRLATIHGAVLKLDASFFYGHHPNSTPRCFQLEHLNIDPVFARPWEVARMTGRAANVFGRAYTSVLRSSRIATVQPNIYYEPHFHYDPKFEYLPNNIYLDGYWQSEKYFLPIVDRIRADFTVNTPLDGKNRELADRIQSCTSVSIHVRRGDYVNDPKTARYHGTCSIDYYRTSINQIIQKIAQPHFFVFSDDPEWARQNLHVPAPAFFVTQNTSNNAHEDLRLLSLCRHHIIANSSFSWWGAWLSSSPEKQVYAPDRWFLHQDLDTRDLIPTSWMRVKN